MRDGSMEERNRRFLEAFNTLFNKTGLCVQEPTRGRSRHLQLSDKQWFVGPNCVRRGDGYSYLPDRSGRFSVPRSNFAIKLARASGCSFVVR